MPDLLTEQRLSLAKLARQEGFSIPTAWRWAQRGVNGVRLESILIGGRRHTSEEAFRRFVQATNAAANRNRLKTRTGRQREAALRKAAATLAEA